MSNQCNCQVNSSLIIHVQYEKSIFLEKPTQVKVSAMIPSVIEHECYCCGLYCGQQFKKCQRFLMEHCKIHFRMVVVESGIKFLFRNPGW